MNLNLEKYVLKIDEFIDKNLCSKIVNKLKKCEWKKHTFYNPKTDEYNSISGDEELQSTNEVTKYNEIVIKKLWQAINKYINSLNFPWYSGWNGYTGLKFNRYSVNNRMENHCDHIHSIFLQQPSGIPVLSIVGSLNDDYEGGEFIMFNKKKIKLKCGDLIIFPSNFLYPHKVNIIKKGTRYSYVSWVY